MFLNNNPNKLNVFSNISECILFTPVEARKICEIIKGERIIDFLTFSPKKCIEIIFVNNFLDILNYGTKPNTMLTLLIEIDKVFNLPHSNQFIVEGRCYNAQCKLLFFKSSRLLYSIYKPGTTVIVSGKVEILHNKVVSIIHPIHKGNDLGKIANYEIQITYCNNRLKNNFIKKKINHLLNNLFLFDIPQDWIPEEKRQEYNLPTFIEAIKNIHAYQSNNIFTINNSKNRLILDEIITYHLLLRSYSTEALEPNAEINEKIENLINDIVKKLNLPFILKEEQKNSLNEIFYDIIVRKSLYRLLQGDVGSGKTLVALILTYYIVSRGEQVALLVPSLSLSNQHYKYFQEYLPGINILLFNQNTANNSKKRQVILSNIADGTAQIIIGTHSLLSEELQFKNLSLIIFDEHHKFGVMQRSQIANKSTFILSMTATPNPRTMMFTYYGFLDLSKMKNINNNRKTFSIDITKIDKILNKLSIWLKDGEKIYWICSKVNSNENTGREGMTNPLTSCIDRYNSIKNMNLPVGMVHGQLSPDEITENLDLFKENKIKILICTTVIEVGIDIHDATIMIIENAEMFGINQLHQLRGRVGRGSKLGKCLLIYNQNIPEYQYKIEKFVGMESGFEVSNLDLEIRGPGDIIGTSQKGKRQFQFINKYTEKILFKIAADLAPYIKDVNFIKKLLHINNEDLYLKKN